MSGGGGERGERGEPQWAMRFFPGITASLHWLVTGIGFLLSIWCSIATLKHGDVSWYMVLHQLIPLGAAIVHPFHPFHLLHLLHLFTPR